MTGTLDVKVPADGVIACPGYDFIQGNNIYETDVLVGMLNEELDDLREEIQDNQGEYIDANPLIVECSTRFTGFPVNYTCKETALFSNLFIDKAERGKGKNKFYRGIDPNGHCYIVFKHLVKEKVIDKGNKNGPGFDSKMFDDWIKQNRWKARYDKYIDNPLSRMLNEYIRVTWASHQPLDRDEYDPNPNDTYVPGNEPNWYCQMFPDFLEGMECSNYFSTWIHQNSWFTKWVLTTNKPYMPRYWTPNEFQTGNILDNSYIKDDMLSVRLPCINGKAMNVYARDIVDFTSTVNFAFRVPDNTNRISQWIKPSNSTVIFNNNGDPKLIPNDNTIANLNTLFTSHTYLGKLRLEFRDPYRVYPNMNKKSTLEIWMETDDCINNNNNNSVAPSSTVPTSTPTTPPAATFTLYLKFTDVNGVPTIKPHNIIFPSEQFDKLVYYGFPDPGGCRSAQLENLNGPELGNFFDVIGGFYINDNGYLAFHDENDPSSTTSEYEFNNIRLNCLNDNCTPDTVILTCHEDCVPSTCGNLCVKWTPPPPITATPVKFREKSCAEFEINRLVQTIESKLTKFHNDAMNALRVSNANNCVKPENINDELKASYDQNYYHYTLYYYDRAGRLVKTVPPKGVVPIAPEPITNVYLRKNTQHKLVTTYKYNSLGQMTEQNTPDGGTTKFWYDAKGRICISRNAKQTATATNLKKYSYTLYDNLSRIIEVGEASSGANNGDSYFQNMADGLTQMPAAGSGLEYTHTYYSDPPESGLPAPFDAGDKISTQKFLLNRVSWTKTRDADNQITRTFYSYDPHGNVEWLIQDIPGLGASCTDYDLISGKVVQVSYQDGFKDRFYHRYKYDADNRVIAVETSHDQKIWERDAAYDYYLHGPLKRVVTGRDLVQGTDFTYTIQGWLKGINYPLLSADGTIGSGDPGNDWYMGISSPNSTVGLDAFGTTLSYYSGDFVHSSSAFESGNAGLNAVKPPINNQYTRNLYNGNIAGWVTGYRDQTGARTEPLAGIYRYDVLNRLREDEPQKWSITGTNDSWSEAGYFSDYNYDPNGNLTKLDRTNKNNISVFDEFTYHYPTGMNRLEHISDAAASGEVNYDIDNQQTGNYEYDASGRLIKDVLAGITNIGWTVLNKVSYVEKTDGSIISFMYDGKGNRIRKFVDVPNSTIDDKTTWYIRDASGNVVSTYAQTGAPTADISQIEVPLNGADRLGIWKPNITRDNSSNTASTTETIFTRNLGSKLYELKDHLGNIRGILNDLKKEMTNGSFSPVIVSYSNYYPFGMQMYEDTWQSPLYRYGYNGQEKDNDINSSDNIMTAEFWEYDSRAAKRWNQDPVPYPYISNYAVFGGNPILHSDPKGDKVVKSTESEGQTAIVKSVEEQYQKFVKFDEVGRVDVKTLKDGIKGADVNSNPAILLRMAENPETVELLIYGEVTTKTSEGKELIFSQDNIRAEGITFPPKFDPTPTSQTIERERKMGISTNGNIMIIINTQNGTQTRQTIEDAVTEELYAHASFYMQREHLFKSGYKPPNPDKPYENGIFPWHFYEMINGDNVDKNTRLHQRIKQVNKQHPFYLYGDP